MLDIYRNEGKKFDVIINDLTDIPIATSPQGIFLMCINKKIMLAIFCI